MNEKELNTAATFQIKTILACLASAAIGASLFMVLFAYKYGSRITAIEKDVEYIQKSIESAHPSK